MIDYDINYELTGEKRYIDHKKHCSSVDGQIQHWVEPPKARRRLTDTWLKFKPRFKWKFLRSRVKSSQA